MPALCHDLQCITVMSKSKMNQNEMVNLESFLSNIMRFVYVFCIDMFRRTMFHTLLTVHMSILMLGRYRNILELVDKKEPGEESLAPYHFHSFEFSYSSQNRASKASTANSQPSQHDVEHPNPDERGVACAAVFYCRCQLKQTDRTNNSTA